MNLKELFQNKKVVISIITIAAIFIFALISLAISHILSDKAILSKNSDVSSPIDSTASDLKNDGAIDIVPLISDSTGVNVKSGFKILCENTQTQTFFQKALTISPQQDYEIKEVSDKEFHIKFNDTLEPNSIYKIGLSDNTVGYQYSWAFQTQKIFTLVRSLPYDRSAYVPVDSGIELTFSHEGISDIEKYFEITPKVDGHFEHHSKTIVFIPEKLEYGTVYTVTLKEGLGLHGSDATISDDYTFTFETRRSDKQESTNQEYLGFTEILNNFTPDTAPILEVNASQHFKDQDIAVEVYKYASESDLLADVKQYDTPAYRAFGRSSSLNFDISKLQKVTEFNTKMMNNTGDYWYKSFILFPSSLPEGHYLINVKSKNATYQTHVQVNDLSVYAMAGIQESLVWVNRSSTGTPVEGAIVSIDGIQPAKTNKDGIAVISEKVFKEPKDQKSFFKISEDKGPVLLAPLSYYSYQYAGDKNAQKYWAYLYSDRDLYLPTDTIQIWGMTKPRNGEDLPSKAMLILCRTDYTYEGDNKLYGGNSKLSEIISKEINISELGTFKSSIELSNFNAGSYFIQLKLGNEAVIQKYFDIRQYTKPAYKIDINSDKKAMFEWEKLNVDIRASFFEGSPVSGLDLKYSHYTTWDNHKEGNIVCDENGKAALEVSSASSDKSWHPLYLTLYLNNAKTEEEEIYAYSSTMVFPRDTMIEVKTSSKSQTGIIDINTNRINLEKIRNRSDWWYDAAEYRGNAVDIPVKIRIYEKHWDRKETGEYYDFINKKVRKYYSYFEVINLLQEFDANTASGNYSYEFAIQENKNYFIEAEGSDSRQNSIIETAYLYKYPQPSEHNLDRYSLSTENDRSKFKLEDTIALTVKKNELDLPKTSNDRFLYMILKNGIFSYTVKDDPYYSLEFTKEYVPNIYIKAVYFDGRNVFNVENKPINYDYEEKALNISIKPDKEEYRPGDTVQLDIDVKDMQGVPYSAEVNLSVVDEAFFAVHNQYVDTLSSLYRYCFHSGILSEYLSYKPLNIDGGAPEQGGEGGDESIRSMFKDNAFFDTITTDNSGKGKTSFKLPDNLTSWRITYQGITNDLKAGNGKINIDAKLPFFVDVLFNNIFIDGDTVNISARSFGTKLEKGKSIDYTVLLEKKNGVNNTFKAQGNSDNLVNIELGKLTEGDYSVTINAQHGDYNDAVKRNFKVVKSILEASRLNHYKLTDSLKIEGEKSLTTLSFYNEETSASYNAILSLMNSWGDRVDQKLSRKIAKQLMHKHYGAELGWAEDDTFNSYQQHDGGIALLPYASSSPEITAKISSLADDLFDSTAMKFYLYKTLDNKNATPEDVTASLWGLAALDEPVLIDIINLLESNSIGIKEKLYLGIGLAELGSLKPAWNLYSDIIRQYGITNSPYVYINSKDSRDNTIELTSLCSVLGMKINAPEKSGLFRYVQDNSTRDVLTNMESLIYINDMIPDAKQKGSFTIEADGQTKNVSLDKNEILKLVLTPEALKNIKFSNINGDIAVTSSFIGPVKDLVEDTNKLVKIKRSYSVDGKTSQSFNQSELIKIALEPEFTETAPDGYYEITDILPAGLRYVSSVNQFDRKWYPGERNGQKVTFGFFYDKNNKSPDKAITYYARAVTPGGFTADYTFIKHSKSDVSGFAEKMQVVIKKGDK
ncbi:MAG: Ig-like domain-containing protein [Clostridia bacterium]